ncbi:MAG: hypothetical protein AVDCRST_MAG60-2363 [uncultured Nocardioides sp.]|uniref:SAF domain-containing protein n=1 Tax=uncultured Nocardioides sp. TaxID=198441 RepID=A0A6J4PBT8_9ACTN|nr:MAG: hypothetical protein AVDCRST_MAG60-2363 [uncultured Nocardioides sp.]
MTLAVLVGLRATIGPAPASTPVAVAAHDLSAGDRLSPDDVSIVAWPDALVPAGLVAAPVGQVLAASVRSGEAITDVRLLGSRLADAHPGLTVMPLRLPDAAVVDLLETGDSIDLSAVDPETGASEELATDVLVLAIPPPSVGDSSLTGRLVVAGLDPPSSEAVAAAALRQFLTVAYAR